MLHSTKLLVNEPYPQRLKCHCQYYNKTTNKTYFFIVQKAPTASSKNHCLVAVNSCLVAVNSCLVAVNSCLNVFVVVSTQLTIDIVNTIILYLVYYSFL